MTALTSGGKLVNDPRRGSCDYGWQRIYPRAGTPDGLTMVEQEVLNGLESACKARKGVSPIRCQQAHRTGHGALLQLVRGTSLLINSPVVNRMLHGFAGLVLNGTKAPRPGVGYSGGMRIGPPLRLCRGDVDWMGQVDELYLTRFIRCHV